MRKTAESVWNVERRRSVAFVVVMKVTGEGGIKTPCNLEERNGACLVSVMETPCRGIGRRAASPIISAVARKLRNYSVARKERGMSFTVSKKCV